MKTMKIIFRNLYRNGFYSVINIAGLAVSLVTCMLIAFWIQDEMSYDAFYKRANDIYLVTTLRENEGEASFWQSTPTAVSRVGREEIPGVESACSINMNYDLGYVEYEGSKFFGDRYIAADTTFFRVFDSEFIEGDIDHAWPDPYSVVLTQSMAKKIFGNEPALGKTLKGSNGSGGTDEMYSVSAVIADQPKNSYLEYDAIFSFERSRFKNSWMNWSWRSFYLLQPDANQQAIIQQLLEAQQKAFDKIRIKSFHLQPLTDLRMHSADGKETGMASIRLFAVVGIGLLIIACINYVNLTTARANKRNKEIGIKKILGAKKFRLISQLMGETLVLCFVALILALFLVFLLIPYYNYITGKDFIFRPDNPVIWGTCSWMFLFVVLLSGIYPALRFSSFQPLQVLKSQNGGKSKSLLRKLLVIFQFMAVSAFIVSAIVINSQLHYIQNKQLGFDREQMIEMNIFTNLDIRSHYETFKAELEREPSIAGVSASEGSILYAGKWERIDWEGKTTDRELMTSIWGIDRNLCSLMDMHVAAGSGFNGTPGDNLLCLVNETAVRQMGLQDPVGKRISIPLINAHYTIAGVVKDFHFESLDTEIGPMMLIFTDPSTNRYGFSTIYIKTQKGKTHEAIASIEKT